MKLLGRAVAVAAGGVAAVAPAAVVPAAVAQDYSSVFGINACSPCMHHHDEDDDHDPFLDAVHGLSMAQGAPIADRIHDDIDFVAALRGANASPPASHAPHIFLLSQEPSLARLVNETFIRNVGHQIAEGSVQVGHSRLHLLSCVARSALSPGIPKYRLGA